MSTSGVVAPVGAESKGWRRAQAKLPVLIVPALVALLLAMPTCASAYLYWHSAGIGRADLNGAEVTPRFIPSDNGAVFGVAISSRYIYFGGAGGIIERANLNGKDLIPDVVSIPQPKPGEPGDPYGHERDADFLAVSGKHIYWTISAQSTIGRANIDGTDVEPGFIKTDSRVDGVAVDASHIYWATQHAIGRANVDGSNIEQNFIPVEAISVNCLTMAGAYIYWTTNRGHSIGRASLDGRAVKQHFITIPGYPSTPAVGGDHIYWRADEHLFSLGQIWIGRANLSGRGLDDKLINVTHSIGGELVANGLGPDSASVKRAARSSVPPTR
jgi:hypothetical protein